ncbi:hypothetical protein [Streptomyces hawaiiensis]|uniref:hypothetical protein n=1 Tax=Streptomyces hawaiiensis TaxID=67305 RepID=UPI0036604EF1
MPTGPRLIIVQQGAAERACADDLREDGVDSPVAAETEHRASVLPMVPEGVGPAVVTDPGGGRRAPWCSIRNRTPICEMAAI